ncbi:MAG: ABC transporter ATP-binding protein [Bacteroidales bacterium]|nr:ABC transporter ATP-binding protein [Bacteroidales bacterium]
MDILVLDKICKSYGDGEGQSRTVLQDVSLTLAEGEFLAVTGPSGSGKTTLLRIMGSLLEPDSGKCFIDSEDISGCRDLPGLRNRKIGFVFQDHRLLPQLSVLQNVLLPALAGNKEASEDTVQYARHLLEYTGISELGQRYPESISGGEAARVALCRALVMKPRIILADEPTGQLDHDNALNIARLLKTVSRDFRTGVVMVTHSDEVAALADRQVSLYRLNNKQD